jgi:hypothetical protein
MKFFFSLIILSVILFVLFFPLVNTERQCYEISQTYVDIISTNIFNQRITKDTECSQRMDVLYNLELCIQDATKSSMVAMYSNNMIQRIVSIIRPYAKNLWTLKEEHNQACENFSWYKLP